MALLRVIVWGRLDTGLGESVVNYLLWRFRARWRWVLSWS
jgi:hypothetical protein